MADTLNTRFTNSLYTVKFKLLLLQSKEVVLKYFLEYSTTFFANYQPISIRRVDKIGIMPCYANMPPNP